MKMHKRDFYWILSWLNSNPTTIYGVLLIFYSETAIDINKGIQKYMLNKTSLEGYMIIEFILYYLYIVTNSLYCEWPNGS